MLVGTQRLSLLLLLLLERLTGRLSRQSTTFLQSPQQHGAPDGVVSHARQDPQQVFRIGIFSNQPSTA